MTRASPTSPYAQRKAAELRRIRNESTHVDAAPAREHVRRLARGGLPLRSIASAAGQSAGFVNGVANGRFARIAAELSAALLAVDFRPRATQATVIGVGLGRRVHALAWLGWSVQYQADALGLSSVSNLSRLTSSATARYDRWRAVAELYRDHVDRHGPCDRSRRWATGHGWAPPQAWTVDTIDHPHAWPRMRPLWTPASVVDPHALHAAATGSLPVTHLTRAERRVLIDQRHEQRKGA